MRSFFYVLLCLISIDSFAQTFVNGYYLKADGAYVPAKVKLPIDGQAGVEFNKLKDGLEVIDSFGTRILQPTDILEFGFSSDFQKHRYLSKPISKDKVGFVELLVKGSKLNLYRYHNYFLNPLFISTKRKMDTWYGGKQYYTIQKDTSFIFLTSTDTNETCKKELTELFAGDKEMQEFIDSLFVRRRGILEIPSIIKVINDY